jgi:peptidoglycan/LPS O-acetylase OafA/YrhL
MSEAQGQPQQGRMSELPALTGLRGFAALWVLLYHVWAMSGGPAFAMPGLPSLEGATILSPVLPFLKGATFLSLGWAGVDLFFCLSAFLLVLPFANWRYAAAAKPASGRYLMRRVLRIYPAYLFQLAILVLLAALFGSGRVLSAGELLAHLFLWFNMGWDWVTPLVGVWFTLPIEFSFYLLLPFLAPLIDRRRWPWLLLGAIVVSIGYRYLTHLALIDQPPAIQVLAIERLPGRIDQFVIGMLAGTAFVVAGLRGWRPHSPQRWFWAGMVGLLAVCAAIVEVADSYWAGHPLLYVWHALFSACLVPVLLACAWDAKPATRLLANRPMRYLGDISFGVYLWHMPIVLAILPHLPDSWPQALRFWVLLVTVLVPTLLVAEISHRFIERPFLQRKPPHRV